MTRKSSRDSGSVQGSQQERETVLSEQRDLHNFLERKADQAFQRECAAQTKLSQAQSELDRRERKMQNADRALCDTGKQLQSRRMELYQANQLTDRTQRVKSWLCEELEMIKKGFSGRSCKTLSSNRRITKKLLYRS